jgi:hypothetical protein
MSRHERVYCIPLEAFTFLYAPVDLTLWQEERAYLEEWERRKVAFMTIVARNADREPDAPTLEPIRVCNRGWHVIDGHVRVAACLRVPTRYIAFTVAPEAPGACERCDVREATAHSDQPCPNIVLTSEFEVTLEALADWCTAMLAHLPGSTRVIVASDPEGNQYRNLMATGVERVYAPQDGTIELVGDPDLPLDPEDADTDEDDDHGTQVIVLWPG